MSDFLDRLTDNQDDFSNYGDDYLGEYDFYMFDDDIWSELEFLDAHAPSPEELIMMDANAEQLLEDIKSML